MELSSASHAFVTGGASGIGLGIADALADRGIRVTIADIDQAAVDRVVAGRPGLFRGTVLDVRDRAGWASARSGAEAAFGPVDILVNNAGIGPDGYELADMEPESFDRMIAINLTSVFNGVSAFAGDMRGRGSGHIVNTASMAGLNLGQPTIGGYSAAKCGVVGLSEVLRRELAPHGVGVSVLCPGQVATNLGDTTIKLGSPLRRREEMIQDTGVDASQVGAMAVEGIARNRAYIITHPGLWPVVEKRTNRLRAAFHADAPQIAGQ